MESSVAWKLRDYVAHAGNVHCLALSQKTGRFMATGGDDKKVNLWSLDKPNCLVSFHGHESPIEVVKFSHDENHIGSGCDAGVVKIWDIAEAKILRHLKGHKGAVCSMELYPFAEFVASAAADNKVKLWDLRRKGCINTYAGHSQPVKCIRFSPDGRWMVSTDDSGVIKVWELAKGTLLFELNEHTASVNSVQFHPSELMLASGSIDKSVKFWDLDTKQLISSTHTVHGDSLPVGNILFHPGGECLYSTSKGMLTVYGWEPVCMHRSINLPITNDPADVAFSENQLVGACFTKNNVSTFVVEINKLPPIGGSSQPSGPAARQLSQGSGRKTFVAGQVGVAPAEKANRQGKPDPVAVDEEVSGANGVFVSDPDYRKVKEHYQPFRAPDSAVCGGGDAACRDRYGAAVQHQNGASVLSEADALSRLSDGRPMFMTEMTHRGRSMRIIASEWKSSGVKTAVEVAIGMRDYSVVYDLLQVMLCKVDLWDLSVCQTMLPTLGEMIGSKHEHYMHIALSALRLILNNFGSLIKANVATPPPQGVVDFSRQDRYYKCLSCFNKLIHIRTDLDGKLNKYEGRLGAKIQEMHGLIQQVTRR